MQSSRLTYLKTERVSSQRVKKENVTVVTKDKIIFINLKCAVNNMNKYRKDHVHASQYGIFLSAIVVYTTSVLTILSKNMPDHLGLSIMMLWFIALSVSILQQLPEELIMVCNLFSRTGSSCQQEPLTGKGSGCLPTLLSQTRENRSVNPPRIHSEAPASWTDNSCFFQDDAVEPNSIKMDLLLNFHKNYETWLN